MVVVVLALVCQEARGQLQGAFLGNASQTAKPSTIRPATPGVALRHRVPFTISDKNGKCSLSSRSSCGPVECHRYQANGRQGHLEATQFVMEPVRGNDRRRLKKRCPYASEFNSVSRTVKVGQPTVVQIRDVTHRSFLAPGSVPGNDHDTAHAQPRSVSMTTSPYYFCVFFEVPTKPVKSLCSQNGSAFRLTTVKGETGECNKGYHFMMMMMNGTVRMPSFRPDNDLGVNTYAKEVRRNSTLRIDFV